MQVDPCHPAHHTAASLAASTQAATVTNLDSLEGQVYWPAASGVMGRVGLGPPPILRKVGKESRGVRKKLKGAS